MKNIIKILTLFILLGTLLNAAPVRGGLITFTQPDGSTFEGYLKGDSTFNWIESGSNVVMYSQEDNFYYNAEVSKSGKLVMSKEKPSNAKTYKSARAYSVTKQEEKNLHKLDKNTKNALREMQKEARRGSHPR